jgi:hypothetical protein
MAMPLRSIYSSSCSRHSALAASLLNLPGIRGDKKGTAKSRPPSGQTAPSEAVIAPKHLRHQPPTGWQVWNLLLDARIHPQPAKRLMLRMYSTVPGDHLRLGDPCNLSAGAASLDTPLTVSIPQHRPFPSASTSR